MNTYQAIVIGGGHNGLVAAAYLAKAGAKVVVCEARHKTGGAAATDRPWPDHPEFAVTTLSYVMSLMPDRIIRDLRMAEHGYRVHAVGPQGTYLIGGVAALAAAIMLAPLRRLRQTGEPDEVSAPAEPAALIGEPVDPPLVSEPFPARPVVEPRVSERLAASPETPQAER